MDLKRSHSFNNTPIIKETNSEDKVYLQQINTEKLSSEDLLNKIEEENCCIICTDPLSLDDRHHVVALKCGHIFGKSCIEEWLKPANRHNRCPTCNKKATKKDILKIYSRCVRPTDPREQLALESKIRRLQASNLDLEDELEVFKINLRQTRMELDSLKSELYRYQSVDSLSKMKGTSSRSIPSFDGSKIIPVIEIDTPKFSLSFIRDLNFEDITARMHSFATISESIVTTVQSQNNTLFNTQYGIRRTTVDGRVNESYYMHTKMIRDMFIDQMGNCCLTVASDKTLKISSLVTKNTINSLELPNEAYCVHANSEQFPDSIYVGFRNGDLAVYDRRNLTTPIDMISSINKTPVASLQSLPGYGDPQKQDSLVLAIQLNSSHLYHFESSAVVDPELGSTYRIYKLPFEGKLSNASYDRESNRIMISCRASQKHANNTHYIFNYQKGTFSTPNMLNRLIGGKNQTILTRSKLFTHPLYDDCVIAGSGDQGSKGARFWNTDSPTDFVDVQTRDSVRDIDYFNINNTPFVSCLTEGIVKLYKLE